MKKKFLIPVLGLFTFAMAYTVTSSTLTNNGTPLFTNGDNVAFAAQDCGTKEKHYCIVGDTSTYNEEYCGGGTPQQ